MIRSLLVKFLKLLEFYKTERSLLTSFKTKQQLKLRNKTL